MASKVEQIYRYSKHSDLSEAEGRYQLSLSASRTPNQSTTYFQGSILHPMEVARGLRAISIIVGSRFFIPPAMLERILREADPVVTSSRSMLRFEGFSACCSAYARLDICSDGLEVETLTPGTTNVDFQSEMRAALAKVRQKNNMQISLRSDEFELGVDSEQVVEEKVKLPLRWLKGFAEVQSHQVEMVLRHKINRNGTVKFLRDLPRAKSRHPSWIVSSSKSLRLSHRAVAGAVKIKGYERLRVLEELAPLCDSLSIYAGARDESAWVLSLGTQRFTLVLSADPSRGFSGDGRLLSDLAKEGSTAALAKVKSALAWQDEIEVEGFSEELGLDSEDVDVALATCASNGLLGFDVSTGSYFHRVLPFDMSVIESLSPRLKGARKLVESGAVQIKQNGKEVLAEVVSQDVVHRVKLNDDEEKCTCPWYAKYQGNRGPCKHVLAVQIVTEE
ncbi:MAG: SWIM zinc finger family protein [Candidatus Thiodiazotropha sp. 4PDIV1]